MKSFFIKFLGILSLVLITNVANANVSEVFESRSCSQLKDSLISVKESQNTSSINFKYTEALSCNSSILYKNLIVKMFYMVFGDFSIKSMDIVLSLIGSILDYDFEFYDKALVEVEPIQEFTEFIKIMEGLAFVCCMFLLGFFAIFYIYYLFNSAHDGSALGKSSNVFWTTTRLFAAIFLCVPIDSFGNFTAIQVIVMMFATIGILLANVVWFILPIFELLFVDDVQEIQDKNEFINKTQISSVIDANIQMQICDIQARKGIYLYGLDVKDMTKENIEGSDFGKCIKDNENIPATFLSAAGSLNYIPSSLNATTLCASKTNKDIRVSCGMIEVKDTSIVDQNYLESINKETRQIAYDIIGRYCMDDKFVENDKSEGSYEKECALILNGDTFSYIPKYGKQVIASYTNAPDNGAIIESIKNVKDNLFQSVTGKAGNLILYSVDVADIEEKIALSLIKGWLSASSFILELGSEYKNKSAAFNQAFSSFNSMSKAEISGKQFSLTHYIETQMSKEILSSVEDIKVLSENLASSSNYVQDEKEYETLILKVLFPVIPYIKEFNGMSDVVTSRIEKDDCTKDFNSCVRTSINPLVGLMSLGNGFLDYSISGVVVTEIISKLYAVYGAESKSPTLMLIANINDLLGMLFLANMIIGLMLLYLPGIIIFGFFVGNALGWFSLVIKKVVISPLWMIMHLSPSQNEGFSGKGAGGYKILLDILLRPSFIVFGVFVAFIMLSIMVSLLNVMFGMVLSTFVLFDSPSGIIEFITNFILNMVYVVLLVIVIYRSGKAMYKVPNALSDWFEMSNPEDSSMWTEMSSKIQNFMVTDMKKIIYFSKGT